MLRLRTYLQTSRPCIEQSIKNICVSPSNVIISKQISTLNHSIASKKFQTPFTASSVPTPKKFFANQSSENSEEPQKKWKGRGLIRTILLSVLGVSGVAFGGGLYIFPEWRKNVKNGIVSTGRFLRCARVVSESCISF